MPNPTQPGGAFQWKNPNTAGNINAGLQMGSGLMTALAPNQYDGTVGMERPNPFQTFSNFQLAGMGATFGPVGAAVGAGADVVKNIFAYQKAMQQYQAAKAKTNFMDGRADRQQQLQPDYTGMARYGYAFGGQAMGTTPIEVERNEVIVQPTPDGSYQKLAQTPATAPTHEQGGVTMNVPQGAMVFPAKYIDPINQALGAGNAPAIDMMAMQMKQESDAASAMGLPFSNGSQGRNGLIVQEQKKINELRRKEGKELLAEDGVLGEKTRAAMAEYEGKGYNRPAVLGEGRTETRKTAMQQGVYEGSYWDEKQGVRRLKDGTVLTPKAPSAKGNAAPSKEAATPKVESPTATPTNTPTTTTTPEVSNVSAMDTSMEGKPIRTPMEQENATVVGFNALEASGVQGLSLPNSSMKEAITPEYEMKQWDKTSDASVEHAILLDAKELMQKNPKLTPAQAREQAIKALGYEDILSKTPPQGYDFYGTGKPTTGYAGVPKGNAPVAPIAPKSPKQAAGAVKTPTAKTSAAQNKTTQQSTQQAPPTTTTTGNPPKAAPNIGQQQGAPYLANNGFKVDSQNGENMTQPPLGKRPAVTVGFGAPQNPAPTYNAANSSNPKAAASIMKQMGNDSSSNVTPQNVGGKNMEEIKASLNLQTKGGVTPIGQAFNKAKSLLEYQPKEIQGPQWQVEGAPNEQIWKEAVNISGKSFYDEYVEKTGINLPKQKQAEYMKKYQEARALGFDEKEAGDRAAAAVFNEYMLQEETETFRFGGVVGNAFQARFGYHPDTMKKKSYRDGGIVDPLLGDIQDFPSNFRDQSNWLIQHPNADQGRTMGYLAPIVSPMISNGTPQPDPQALGLPSMYGEENQADRYLGDYPVGKPKTVQQIIQAQYEANPANNTHLQGEGYGQVPSLSDMAQKIQYDPTQKYFGEDRVGQAMTPPNPMGAPSGYSSGYYPTVNPVQGVSGPQSDPNNLPLIASGNFQLPTLPPTPNGTPMPNGMPSPTQPSMTWLSSPYNPLMKQPTPTVQPPMTNAPEATVDPATGERKVTPQDYFNFIRGVDLGSFVQNFTQAPPPNIQTPITHLERLRLDRTPIDTMRQEAGEMGNRSFRELRENVSQSSDLMKGVTAINSGLQEANRQVGTAEREMNNQERMANNQIANQEQATQDQQNTQEMLQNYQIQQQGQQAKNAAITGSLGELKKDLMFEAQYNDTKESQDKQFDIDANQANASLDLQTLMMQYQAGKDFDQQPEYQSAETAMLQERVGAVHDEIIGSNPELKGLSMQQGAEMIGKFPALQAEYQESEKKLVNYYTQMQNARDKAKTATGEEKTKLDSEVAQLEGIYNKHLDSHMKQQQQLQRAKQYKEALSNKWSSSGEKAKFREKYAKERGYLSDADFIAQTKSIADRTRYTMNAPTPPKRR
jgi:hypothetical protein